MIDFTESACSLTGRVREVEDAGGRLQQVGAAGWQVSWNGHDGHAVTTLLGSNNAVVLGLTHATVTTKQSRDGRNKEERGARDGIKKKMVWYKVKRERNKKIWFTLSNTELMS